METKVCTKCGQELPIEQFGLQPNSADGHWKICKSCLSAMRSGPRKRNKDYNPTLCDPRFENFDSRELIAELRHRGYKGELQYVQTIKI